MANIPLIVPIVPKYRIKQESVYFCESDIGVAFIASMWKPINRELFISFVFALRAEIGLWLMNFSTCEFHKPSV